jgi:two-component system, sensor histidine kinase
MMNLQGFFNPEASSVHRTEIQQEFFRLGFGNLKVHLLAHVGLSSLVALACIKLGKPSIVSVWIAYMVAITIALIAGLYGFGTAIKSGKPPTHIGKRWRNYHFAIVCAIGLAWGCLGFLLVPGEETHNLMLFIAFAGTVAYSSASNGPHDFIGFVVSAAIALGILLLQIPTVIGPQAWAVQGMCVLYFLSMTLSARNAKTVLLSSIILRIENEQLAQKNAAIADRADKANRDKSTFLAAASHDLRQPLHALTLLLQTHQLQEPEAAGHPLLQNAKAATDSITQLFNGIMEISSLEAGQSIPIAALFDLKHLLQAVLQQLGDEAKQKNLKLRLFVSRRVSRQTLLTDKALLERVVLNLMSNSIRYTQSGGVLISIRPANGLGEDGGLNIEVWDTGIGIPLADQARVFEPYVQLANKERDREKGLGLGLSIVKGTAAALGFSISIRSTVGKGAIFKINVPRSFCKINRLPPKPREPLSQAIVEQRPSQSSQMQHLKGMRVLFIDDDAMVSAATSALLTSWGADIRSASNLVDAYAILQSNNEVSEAKWLPERILSDFRLPGELDGIEVLRLLKAVYPHAKCFLQTGEPEVFMKDKAHEAGFAVLFKPVAPEALYEALR